MKHRTLGLAALIAAPLAALVGTARLGAAAGAEQADVAAEPSPADRVAAFTADALASLERGAAFLAAQKSYSFGADVSYDVLQPNGQMLEFGGRRDFLVRRPDRLRVEVERRDGDVIQLFFDGRSILVDMPNEDAYVQVEKPGTLYDAVAYLVKELGTPTPLDDFLSPNYAKDVSGLIESGFYAGHVRLGEFSCEQLAFRTREVDFQLWLRAGDEPLPCRLVIRYREAEGAPEFTADFRDWDLSPEADDGMFQFTPPASAERLQAQALDRQLRQHREGR